MEALLQQLHHHLWTSFILIASTTMALRFFHSQLFVTPPIPTGVLTGKTVIVTGANTGLGLEAARHFTRLGASTVVLAVRSLEKGDAAKLDIEASTGITNVVKVRHVDMSSYSSVLEFASTASHELPRINIACLNAGVVKGQWETAESHEATITVNVISTFLLALALLPKLIETSRKYNVRPTMTITTSEVHEFVNFTEHRTKGRIFEALNDPTPTGSPADMGNRYQVSKLLEILALRQLCSLYPSLPVTINCVNPGLCKSDLAREAPWSLHFLTFLLGRRTEVGSRTVVHAGMAGEETHGEYLSDCQTTAPAPWVRSEEGREAQGRVWEELVGILEGVKEGVTKLKI
jgi:NAD(P)-dependent dehydrogenase (short-subunit alcohol dehydrogenase family)